MLKHDTCMLHFEACNQYLFLKLKYLASLDFIKHFHFDIVILFVLKNDVKVNNFSVTSGLFLVFLGWTSTKQRIMCLAQE